MKKVFVGEKRKKMIGKWAVPLRTVFELKKNILFTDKNDREYFLFSAIFLTIL